MTTATATVLVGTLYPLAVEARSRIRPTYMYLYTLLASFYTWSIYSNTWSQKLVVLVLTFTVRLARTRKFMPSGLILAATVAVLAVVNLGR